MILLQTHYVKTQLFGEGSSNAGKDGRKEEEEDQQPSEWSQLQW